MDVLQKYFIDLRSEDLKPEIVDFLNSLGDAVILGCRKEDPNDYYDELKRLAESRMFKRLKDTVKIKKLISCLIVYATSKDCLPVLSLLLEYGANPNVPANGCLPLDEAIKGSHSRSARLLMSHGAKGSETSLLELVDSGNLYMLQVLVRGGIDIYVENCSVISRAIENAYFKNDGSEVSRLGIARVLLSHAIRKANKPGARLRIRQIGKYARLALAIINKDKEKVLELLRTQDGYEGYANIIAADYRPPRLAFWFGGFDMVKLFLEAQQDVKYVFYTAVIVTDSAVLELCYASPSFDPNARDYEGRSVVHYACAYDRFSLLLGLVERFQLDVEAQDSFGRTPIFLITEADILKKFLKAFPDVKINIQLPGYKGKTLLQTWLHNCENNRERYCDLCAILLEHGADPEFGSSNNIRHECNNDRCKIIRHLMKLWWIDQEYVRRIIPLILTMTIQDFQALLPANNEMRAYKRELESLKEEKINRSASTISRKSLYDFMCMSPNEATRFAKNITLTSTYRRDKKGFRKFYYSYGSYLNTQLRRSRARRNRFDEIETQARSILGNGIPDDFTQLVFGNFSNKSLKSFDLGLDGNDGN